jgi:hypothetical protein
MVADAHTFALPERTRPRRARPGGARIHVAMRGGSAALCAGRESTHMTMHTVARFGLSLVLVGLTTTVLSAAAIVALVSPETMTGAGWSAFKKGNASVRFVDETIVPVLGTGAVELALQKDPAAAGLRLSDAMWEVPLDELGLNYRTFIACRADDDGAGKKSKKKLPKAGSASIRVLLDIDTDGDHVSDDLLVFDPALNGGLECGVWQEWAAAVGTAKWYEATKKGGRDSFTFGEYLAENPDAILTFSGIRVVAYGKSKEEFTGYVDYLAVSHNPPCPGPVCLAGPSVTYDFVRVVPPAP